MGFDAGRFEHEAHRGHHHLVHRQCRGGLAPEPGGRLADALAVGRHRFQPAHQNVEQPLARALVGEFLAVLGQYRAIDAARESGQHGALRGERVTEIGERHAGRLADVAHRDVLETPLRRELHQRVDDLAARVGRLGFALRLARHAASPP